jgi:hypothetical protein
MDLVFGLVAILVGLIVIIALGSAVVLALTATNGNGD